LHAFLHQRWHFLGPQGLGGRAVRRLVLSHLLDDRTRLRVLDRQGVQMAIQMRFDLALGFDDEAQAVRIAKLGGRRAQRIGTRIP